MLKSISLCLALAAAALSAPALAQTAPMTPAMPMAAHPTTTSTIKALLADPATKAIMDKHFPGMSTLPMLPQIENMTLAQVMPMSQGNVTAEKIAAVEVEIHALPAH